MPWQLLHKCNLAQATPGEYGTAKLTRNGEDLTQVICPLCRETFYIKGHEWFDEAMPSHEVGANLPAGFLIARTRTQ